jgi:hypothetical protein
MQEPEFIKCNLSTRSEQTLSNAEIAAEHTFWTTRGKHHFHRPKEKYISCSMERKPRLS